MANRANLIRIVPNKSLGGGGKCHKVYAKWLEVQSGPVPAACINKQRSSGSPSSSFPSDTLYQLLLTTKLGGLVAFLRNCLASMYKRIN